MCIQKESCISKGNLPFLLILKEFELALDSSQAIRLQCYGVRSGTEKVLGRHTIELSKEWLKASRDRKGVKRPPRRDVAGSSDVDEARAHPEDIRKCEIAPGLTLSFSVRYVPSEQTIRRVPSRIKSGLFGVPLHLVLRYIH